MNDTTGTRWKRLFYDDVVVVSCDGPMCVVRPTDEVGEPAHRMPRDPETGGPRGYVRCEETKP